MTKQKLAILLALLFGVGCALAQERQQHFELKANSKEILEAGSQGCQARKDCRRNGFYRRTSLGPIWFHLRER